MVAAPPIVAFAARRAARAARAAGGAAGGGGRRRRHAAAVGEPAAAASATANGDASNGGASASPQLRLLRAALSLLPQPSPLAADLQRQLDDLLERLGGGEPKQRQRGSKPQHTLAPAQPFALSPRAARTGSAGGEEAAAALRRRCRGRQTRRRRRTIQSFAGAGTWGVRDCWVAAWRAAGGDPTAAAAAASNGGDGGAAERARRGCSLLSRALEMSPSHEALWVLHLGSTRCGRRGATSSS